MRATIVLATLMACGPSIPPWSPPHVPPPSTDIRDCLDVPRTIYVEADPATGEGRGQGVISNRCGVPVELLGLTRMDHGALSGFNVEFRPYVWVRPGERDLIVVDVEVVRASAAPARFLAEFASGLGSHSARLDVVVSRDVGGVGVTTKTAEAVPAQCAQRLSGHLYAFGSQPVVIDAIRSDPDVSVGTTASFPATMQPGERLDFVLDVPASNATNERIIPIVPVVDGLGIIYEGTATASTLPPDPLRTEIATWFNRGEVPVDLVVIADRADPEVAASLPDLVAAGPVVLSRFARVETDAQMVAIVDERGCPYGDSVPLTPADGEPAITAALRRWLDVDESYFPDDYLAGDGLVQALAAWEGAGACPSQWRRAGADVHVVWVGADDVDADWRDALHDLDALNPGVHVTPHVVLPCGSRTPNLDAAIASRGGTRRELCEGAREAWRSVGDRIVALSDRSQLGVALSEVLDEAPPYTGILRVDVNSERIPTEAYTFDPSTGALAIDAAWMPAKSQAVVRYTPPPEDCDGGSER